MSGVHNEELTSLKHQTVSTFLTPLRPVRDGTPIIGIDVSSVRIGETDNGVIYAVRGTIVRKKEQRYRYVRLGPFPFHITEENKGEILIHLGQRFSRAMSLGTLTLVEAQSHLCNLVERWTQMSIAFSESDSVILWDGSLTTGTPGNTVSAVSQILQVAERNSNSILAFSKATTVRFFGLRITDLIAKNEPPCLFELDGLPLSISKTVHLLGRICVTKLTAGGCSFRLDIDRNLPREQGVEAVERLLGNESLFQGYPESLRLAHIYSTFTANDIIGIRRYLAQEYGLEIVRRLNMHRTLFGPYGTGFED